MHIVIWLLIVLCFLFSFVGLVFPLIPAVLLIWVGAALYHVFLDPAALSWLTWGSFVWLTLLLFATDSLAGHYFVKRFGGSPRGRIAAVIGVIVGAFVLPPFGILIVPLVLVLIAESLQNKPWEECVRVAVGTFLAFLSGTLAKGLIHLAMIATFLWDVWRG